MAKAQNRADFTAKTKRALAAASDNRCSRYECHRPTTYCEDLEEGKYIANLGEAAHIYSASRAEPRTPPENFTDDQISNYANGIWLCRLCHKIVDLVPVTKYTVEYLREMKAVREFTTNLHVTEPDLFPFSNNLTDRDVSDIVKHYLSDLTDNTGRIINDIKSAAAAVITATKHLAKPLSDKPNELRWISEFIENFDVAKKQAITNLCIRDTKTGNISDPLCSVTMERIIISETAPSLVMLGKRKYGLKISIGYKKDQYTNYSVINPILDRDKTFYINEVTYSSHNFHKYQENKEWLESFFNWFEKLSVETEPVFQLELSSPQKNSEFQEYKTGFFKINVDEACVTRLRGWLKATKFIFDLSIKHQISIELYAPYTSGNLGNVEKEIRTAVEQLTVTKNPITPTKLSSAELDPSYFIQIHTDSGSGKKTYLYLNHEYVIRFINR